MHELNQSHIQEKVIEFEDIFKSVMIEAREKAEDDCKMSESRISLDEALSVYKILLLDSSSLKVMTLDSQTLKSGYRGLALGLHPDKNRHPLST